MTHDHHHAPSCGAGDDTALKAAKDPVCGVPVAAGVPYPAFGVLLSPMLAAAAMALSPASVIGDTLRLRAADLG